MNKLIKKSPATIIVISCCVLVFIVQVSIQSDVLFYHGANFYPFTINGEYWRLYSSMFMHGNLIHLVVNMYGLYGIGIILEPFLGTKRFALLYVLAGIFAGLASLYFNLYVPSVGASGAIFGLYGYMITRQVLVNFNNRAIIGGIFLNFLIFVGVNYAISLQVNVDTPGHLGGFISGAVCAIIHFFNLLLRVWQFALATVVSHLLVFIIPKDKLHYYNAFQHIIKVEDRMQSIGNQLLTNQIRADSLRKIALAWDSIGYELRNLNRLPAKLVPDVSMLKSYTAFRVQEINYRILEYERETYVYLDSIEIIRTKIDSLPPLEHPLIFGPAKNVPKTDTLTKPTSSNDWIKIFYDSAWRETENPSIAQYYRLGHRDSLQQWQGDVVDFFLNGNVQMKGRYLNGMKDGIFRYYTKNSRYQSLGRYSKENAVGKWESYYPNRQLQREIYYTGNRSFTKTVYDSVGQIQVANGNGKQITRHRNGAIAEEGTYENGSKEGYWSGFYANGKPHYREFYRHGLLAEGVAMNEKGERYVYDQLSIFPFPVIPMNDYKKYLERNKKNSPEIAKHHGTVKLTFLVDTDGSIRDFVIIESVCVPCAQEAIRLVKEGPRWRPGVLRGHSKIRSTGFVEVLF